ncbi:metallophosphoesterase [Paenibacillus sp. UNC499MF]|uniref:metallophosphoesterase family protein n=1 Tax=Paenibacillus sp. UNC499MF TaxID=1502751 RepID=UPI0008A06EBC|nr:metallophosphoesterase [Paenibacillus sp. UNC499MF]SEF61153.1 Calcineurin-like phosphoesterase [Paenibacillus sp. UNC499MF]
MKFTFAVLSDIHVVAWDPESHRRLEVCLKDYAAMKHPPDFIVINGDLTEGFAEDYTVLKRILSEHARVPVYVTNGNHEYYRMWYKDGSFSTDTFPNGWSTAEAMARFLGFLGKPLPYYDLRLKGLRFVFMSAERYRDTDPAIREDAWISDGQFAWLERILREESRPLHADAKGMAETASAAEADPAPAALEAAEPESGGAGPAGSPGEDETGLQPADSSPGEVAYRPHGRKRPVFVFLHQPLPHTVAGSYDPGEKGVVQDVRLRELLGRHPNVCFFSGHTHYTLASPGIYFEDGCSHMGTSSVRRPIGDGIDPAPVESESVLVEVAPHSVTIRGRRHNTGEWLPSAVFEKRY